ncbi:uncharacterized protein FOMMEDRAFT_154558 [Fomitiporia mediterranea MF3/22]|uniref:uncharacterized protein n=1 Tax=Fomitiporia mediterranea (strain MF3/22) TaxID=694068 RepID=UPI0004408B6B|nr:uncharacterized protein FOMMEDRAFT_154558 [Fomitiporia mediterranea MF3/22]EJD03486.1 hypothetical protein FOMMEDRAFT_154558 [Fomitiporia mediterranea MF3/22]
MGVNVSTARLVAPGAFAINFAAQVYGMLASPNMKEVADRNHYAFSPSPFFIAAFFAPQMILQLAWIRKLFGKDSDVDQAQLDYVPIYALGNICIAGWMVFWNHEKFTASQLLVSINTFAQLYAVARLPAYTQQTALTHWVAKTTAGIGLLDFVDNGAVALAYSPPPSTLVQILAAAFFGIPSILGDPILGGCIIYDLVALYSGQQGSWRSTLGWFATGSAAIVGLKSIFL